MVDIKSVSAKLIQPGGNVKCMIIGTIGADRRTNNDGKKSSLKYCDKGMCNSYLAINIIEKEYTHDKNIITM